MCGNWKHCLGTIRGHQGASNPSASRQEQPKSAPGRGNAPAPAVRVRKCSFTSNLNAPGYTARSLFLFFVPEGTSFCSLSNREVVKLKRVAVRPAAASSGEIIQAPSPPSRGVFLEPLGLLWACQAFPGSQAPGFVVNVRQACLHAGQQYLKGGNGRWQIHITKQVNQRGVSHPPREFVGSSRSMLPGLGEYSALRSLC